MAKLTLIRPSGPSERLADADLPLSAAADTLGNLALAPAPPDRSARDAHACDDPTPPRDLAADAMRLHGAGPARSVPIQEVLARRDVWRGRRSLAQHAVLPTGHDALDALLPGGGWPLGALTEICSARLGLGELALVMPGLARLARAERWVAFVDSPMPLYGPGLVQAGLPLPRVLAVSGRAADRRHAGAWAAEQMLRGGACGAAVLWLTERDDDRALRRLQLAAEASQGFGVVLRPLAARTRTSPAAVRLSIEDGRRVKLFKCRGLDVSPSSAATVALH